jgi:hypothetical protein
MTKQVMIDVKDFLTTYRDGQFKRIVDLDSLRMNHSNGEIIDFLKSYLREKEKSLRNMILIDKTHPKIDEIVVAMFRLHMAINTLEDRNSVYFNEKEVRRVVKLKRGTGKSGELYRRNRSGDSMSRFREDKDNDGKDQHPGDKTRSVA